jgi:hypothetical protein
MSQNVDSLQNPSDNVVVLLSYVSLYDTIRHTSVFFFFLNIVIFLTTVLLAANHCNCMCTLRFKTPIVVF